MSDRHGSTTASLNRKKKTKAFLRKRRNRLLLGCIARRRSSECRRLSLRLPHLHLRIFMTIFITFMGLRGTIGGNRYRVFHRLFCQGRTHWSPLWLATRTPSIHRLLRLSRLWICHKLLLGEDRLCQHLPWSASASRNRKKGLGDAIGFAALSLLQEKGESHLIRFLHFSVVWLGGFEKLMFVNFLKVRIFASIWRKSRVGWSEWLEFLQLAWRWRIFHRTISPGGNMGAGLLFFFCPNLFVFAKRTSPSLFIIIISRK